MFMAFQDAHSVLHASCAGTFQQDSFNFSFKQTSTNQTTDSSSPLCEEYEGIDELIQESAASDSPQMLAWIRNSS